MDELTRKVLVEQCENIIADVEERQLDSTDWEGLNYEELKCISECLQFGQAKINGTIKDNSMKCFRCYYYDPYKDVQTVCIVMANSVDVVKQVLEEKYTKAGIASDEWKIDEIEFSESGWCEVYYG